MTYTLGYDEVLKKKIKQKQDYIFLDPPYQSDLLYKAIQIIIEKDILQDGGIIIAETDKIEEVKDTNNRRKKIWQKSILIFKQNIK